MAATEIVAWGVIAIVVWVCWVWAREAWRSHRRLRYLTWLLDMDMRAEQERWDERRRG